MPSSAEALRELLEVEELDVNLYRGRQPDTLRQRVFGGQVAAQALLAACRTVPAEFTAHSLHSYFLRAGDHSVPIIYDVERIRDGRSFLTRRVSARQHGRPIFYMTCNFQVEEEGLEHQERMPDVKPPELGFSLAEMSKQSGDDEWEREWAALDVRYLGNSRIGLPPNADQPAQALLWIRVDGRLNDDPVLHQAAFTFASDLTLLGAALVPHGLQHGSPGLNMASLDHTIWFHRPFRADEWWLYDQNSPSASSGRGLSLARVFTADGELVATVAQEGVIRYRDPQAKLP